MSHWFSYLSHVLYTELFALGIFVLCYVLFRRFMFYYSPSLFEFFCMFCSLFCVFCVFVLFCVLFLLMYIVPLLFMYKCADQCHRVKIQLQLINIIPYHIKEEMYINLLKTKLICFV
jgi:hypothetical protein